MAMGIVKSDTFRKKLAGFEVGKERGGIYWIMGIPDMERKMMI